MGSTIELNNIVREFEALVPFAIPVALGTLSLLFLYFVKGLIFSQKKGYAKLPPVPVVPGLPLIGNLLQLKEKKPYKTFTKWGETYGPIYSIRTGASTLVVLNSTDVAKEALGQNIEDSVYVEELGTTLSRDEIFKIVVADVLEGALEVDWRDLFPYLRRWVPNNKSLEMKIQGIYFRRKAVLMNSLIKEQTN